jgi:hypothetical protein
MAFLYFFLVLEPLGPSCTHKILGSSSLMGKHLLKGSDLNDVYEKLFIFYRQMSDFIVITKGSHSLSDVGINTDKSVECTTPI